MSHHHEHHDSHHEHHHHHVARVGKPAPNFEATAVVGQDFKTVKLSDYQGNPFLCPADFARLISA